MKTIFSLLAILLSFQILANDGTLRITSANPKKIYVNEISGNDKWLEVYNDENTAVDLSGYTIQKIDELGVIANWKIPSGVTISGKGYKVWTQNESGSFTWGISAKKDVAFKILDTEGNTLDSFEVKMPNMNSEGINRTVGRKTDGASELVIFRNGGTKGASNNGGTQQVPSANPKKIYINEISGNEKWLEIYNAENDAVNLSEYYIQKIDEVGATDNWVIPSATTINAKGCLSWTQDANCTNGSTFTWGISAKKDVAFKVFDNNGTELDYFEIRTDLYSDGGGKTVGRKTDGAKELALFLNGGTKGTTNNNGVLQHPSENPKKIYVNEVSGNDKWIEIYNAEDEVVDLSRYYIQKIDEDGNTDTWDIPSGTTINAKGFLYWTQNASCTDGSTFTWGISAKKDVTFKVFDSNGTELDIFEVRESLYSEGGGKTVGRETDGNNKLIIFEKGTPGASNNNSSSVSFASESEIYKIQNQTITILNDVSFIAITDYSGKVVLKRKVSENQSINLSELPFGIYILQLQLNDKIEVVKFIR